MKFSEKLIKLRKENKLSQEQLASKLDVSRQSVSKWESGQTYPEMDKLLALCKLFKCSLDDLTNDEISKEEMSNNQSKKNSFINLIYEMLEFINKSISMIKSMSFKEIIKMLFLLFLLCMFILVLRIPFYLIENIGIDFIYYIGLNNIPGIYEIWVSLINIVYLILFAIIFIYIYKVRYLDKFEETEKIIIKYINEKKEEKDKNEEKSIYKDKVKVEERVVIKHEKSFALLNVLGTIMKYIIKFIVICIALPFICTLALLAFLFIIDVILIFKGVIFIGIFLGLIFAILFNYMLVEVMFKFIFNMHINLKKIFIMFITSVIGIGVSIGIFTLEATTVKVYDELPKEIKTETINKEFTINADSYIIHDDYNIICYSDNNCDYYFLDKYNIIKKYDEDYNDKVKIELEYHQDFTKVEILEDNGKIDINSYYNSDYNTIIKIFNIAIDNLKKKELYNLDSYQFNMVNVIITTSEKNHEIIQKNTQLKAKEIYQQEVQDIHNYYEEEINRLEVEIDDLNNQIDELQDKYNELEENKNNEIADLETKLEEKETELQDYKKRISELLDE